MSTLRIWLADDVNAPWYWALSDGAVDLAITDDDKAALKSLATNRTEVIIAGQAVRVFPLELPDLKASERLAAAKFAVEDKLAGALVDNHIVIDGQTNGRVFVISHEHMKACVSALTEQGLSPEAIFVDFDVLAGGEAQYEFNESCIQTGPLGYTLDVEWADRPACTPLDPDDAFSRLKTDMATNLCTGTYRARRFVNWNMKSYGRAAILLGACGLSALALYVAETQAIQAQANHVRAMTAQTFTQATGREAPSNPAGVVMRAARSGGQNGENFTRLTAIALDGLKNIEGVSIDTLQYSADSDQITLRLIYPDFESASIVERAIRQNGGTFETGGVRQQGQQYIGDAVIRIGDGS